VPEAAGQLARAGFPGLEQLGALVGGEGLDAEHRGERDERVVERVGVGARSAGVRVVLGQVERGGRLACDVEQPSRTPAPDARCIATTLERPQQGLREEMLVDVDSHRQSSVAESQVNQ
jgi:hypothetical protein